MSLKKFLMSVFLSVGVLLSTDTIVRQYTLISQNGFAYIIDEEGNSVGDRYPQFSNYDLYVQGDGTVYLQSSGPALTNVAWINGINNVFGATLDIDWKNNSSTYTATVGPLNGQISEWVNFNRVIPWNGYGHFSLTVSVPAISTTPDTLRKFVLKSQNGNAVVYDLVSGERTRQTYKQGYHYNLAIARNGAVYCIPRAKKIFENVAYIEQVLNPFGFAYDITVLDKGAVPVTLSTSNQTAVLNKPIPWDQHGGEGLTLTVHKKIAVPVSELPYNYVTFAMTHNAQSYLPIGGTVGAAASAAQAAAGYNVLQVNDQDYSPLQQLQDGIRALAFRVHDNTVNGVTNVYACHGLMPSDIPAQYRPLVESALGVVFQQSTFQPCAVDIGQASLANLLRVVKYFLDKNPSEVVTLVINNQGTPALMTEAFEASDMIPYCYVHTAFTDTWPTLAQLASIGTRLVVFYTGNGQASDYPFGNAADTYLVNTSYSLSNPTQLLAEDLSTAWLSGSIDWTHGCMTLSNYCTPVLAGDKGMATTVNAAAVLTQRAETLKQRIGKYPSFLEVDFYEQPTYDVVAVAQALTATTAQEFLSY